uniref:C4-dicarboxylate transporter/malic acid transport protein n=1 Tax=Tetradesmus obliquus TaxID=3088 RepID=A0A383VX02_TETOB|eukprot:jgi/Sobl393_1/8212/SZX69393.1
MGTGSMAISIHNFPYSFPGQQALALAAWALNVALFGAFLCLLCCRALCYPASARELLEQPNQSLFFGALPMSISVITGGVATLLVPRCHEPAMAAAYALTWANLPLIAVVALLVPFYMFSVHDLSMHTMTTLWLVPVIPGTAAAAVTGAVSQVHTQHDQAVTLLYLGVCMLAVGLALSYHVLGMYHQRLICHKLPPREVIVSSFIPVGAVGMGGWALLNLAAAADTHVRAYHLMLSPSAEDAAWLDAVLPACMASAGVLALCLWAYSGWWLVLAVSSMGQTLRQGIPFTLGWWGAVFPIGTFAGTTLALGHTFHSFAFTVAGAAFSCCQVAVWLFVASRTLYQGWAGDLFHPPCLSPPALLAEHLAAPSAMMRLEKRLSLPSSALPTLATLRRQLDRYPWPDFENNAPLQATSSSWPNDLGRGGSRLHRTHADMHGVLSGCLSVPAASLPSRSGLRAGTSSGQCGLLSGAYSLPASAVMRQETIMPDRQEASQQGVDCVPSLPRTDSGRGVHGYCSAVPAALLRADTFERQIEQRQRQMDTQARLMGLSHSK